MNIDTLYNENGITVAELKRFVAQLPEVDANGEPFTVWVATSWCKSNVVKMIIPLNLGDDGCDLFLDCDSWD